MLRKFKNMPTGKNQAAEDFVQYSVETEYYEPWQKRKK